MSQYLPAVLVVGALVLCGVLSVLSWRLLGRRAVLPIKWFLFAAFMEGAWSLASYSCIALTLDSYQSSPLYFFYVRNTQAPLAIMFAGWAFLVIGSVYFREKHKELKNYDF